MKKHILAFGASSSKQSINKQFAAYAASLLKEVEVNLIDLNDFEMPLFSVDRETGHGVPEAAFRFKELIKSVDGIILSLAEHNSAYSAAYKNIYDWTSRIEQEFWYNKPLLLLSTSPGPRGGKNVMEIAKKAYGRINKNLVAGFSLPSFYANFEAESGITNEELKLELLKLIDQFNIKIQE